MSEDRLSKAKALYLSDKEALNKASNALDADIQSILLKIGIPSLVTARVKSLDSLVKKLILKPDHTYGSVSDLIGARVVVSLLSDAERAANSITGAFVGAQVEKKTGKTNGLGYRGIHVDLEYRGFRAEVQIRTHAQHAWSEVAHDRAYKSPGLPPSVERHLDLLSGAMELADMGFEQVAREIGSLPEQPTLDTLAFLEALYFKLTTHRPNRDISLMAIPRLLNVYGNDSAMAKSRVQTLFENSHDTLERVFERNEREGEMASPLLFQPEVLMVVDLMELSGRQLSRAWAEILPSDDLSAISTEFARPDPNAA